MSKIKSILPRGADITNPLGDAVNPAEEAELERRQQKKEIELGWAIFELKKAAKHLYDNCTGLTVGDLQAISKSTLMLQDIPSKIAKPF